MLDTAYLGGTREGLGISNVDLFPGASSDVWVGLLVNKSVGFPVLMIYSGKNQYSFLDADPFYPGLHQHSYSESSRNDPSCTKAGSVTLKCACGATKTDALSPLGHNMVNGVCSRCGFDLPFNDVQPTDWYYESVRFAVNNGLFNGTSSTAFSPNKTMTRGMLVTVLYRYMDEPAVGELSFTDVPANAYYAPAIAWASENGIVNGVGKNRFNPEGTITREQMATILFRFAQTYGYYINIQDDFSAFSDGQSVSGYAKEAMSWAVGMSLVNGSNGKLMPQSGATRAQVAAILMRFIESCEQF